MMKDARGQLRNRILNTLVTALQSEYWEILLER
jgi:hypothetical protein